MKPVPEPIEIRQVDLSRSQMQSPFVLGQFLEAGFRGLSPLFSSTFVRSPVASPLTSPTSPSEVHSAMHLHDNTQSAHQQDSCTMDTTTLKQYEPQLTHRRSPSSSSSSSSSGKSHARSMTTTRPSLQATRSRTSSFSNKNKTLSSSLWTYLPILLAMLALLVDIPIFVGIVLPAIPSPQHLNLNLNLPPVPHISTMASCTLCGLLCVWICGCVVLVVLAYAVLEIAIAVEAEDQHAAKVSHRFWRQIKALRNIQSTTACR